MFDNKIKKKKKEEEREEEDEKKKILYYIVYNNELQKRKRDRLEHSWKQKKTEICNDRSIIVPNSHLFFHYI